MPFRFWVSDEYGPYIYKFLPSGDLLQTIQPPPAFLPYVNGYLNFSAIEEPTTGRSANQGFEGLTASPDGTTLYAMLQSAPLQDGGSDKTTNRYTRLLAYSVPSGLVKSVFVAPKLIGKVSLLCFCMYPGADSLNRGVRRSASAIEEGQDLLTVRNLLPLVDHLPRPIS
jgi:hypothetical protein